MQLLTEVEMAARLSVTPRTLRNWRSQRLVPFLKLKRVVLFDPAKVLAELEKFERVSRRVS
jgi:DNA-binding transcriptional MerR regulator